MKLENILQQLDIILESEKINDIQETVFVLSWQGRTYEDIAKKTGYDRDYIKDIGCHLWQKLSQKLNVKVSKSNVRNILRKYTQSKLQSVQKNISQVKILVSKIFTYISEALDTVCDWGRATDVSFFVGREKELTILEKWILLDNSRVISIIGMGGSVRARLLLKLLKISRENFNILFGVVSEIHPH